MFEQIIEQAQFLDKGQSNQSIDQHPLTRQFSFWFSINQSLSKKKTWQDGIKKICTFDTIEEFWSYYQHMIRPEQLPNDCGFQLFQEGIKPMWEDEANENGGRFILKIKKQFSNYFWENLILSFIGEEYQENELICGLICSTKDKEIILSIWVRQLPDQTYFNGIREWIRNSLNLSQHIEIEYRDHPKSISNGHTHEKVIGNRFGSSKPKQYDSKFHDQKKTQSGDIEV